MRFSRPLLLLEEGADPRRAAALLRRLAPGAEAVCALAFPHDSPLPTLTNPSWTALTDALASGDALLERLAAALAPDDDRPAVRVEGEATLAFDPEEVEAAAARCEADVVVVVAGETEPTRTVAGWLVRHAQTLQIPVAWCSKRATLPDDVAAAHLLCPFERDLEPLGTLAAFLVDHDRPDGQVTLLGLHASQRGAVPARSMAEVARLGATVRLDWIDLGPSDLLARITDEAARRHTGWLCVPFGAATGLTAARLALLAPQLLARVPVPLLLIPSEVPKATFGTATQLDAPDIVITADGQARLGLYLLGALGVALGPETQEVTVIGAGEPLATGEVHRGEGELELDGASLDGIDALGLARRPDRRAVEHLVRVLRPDERRVSLVDASLPTETIVRLRTLSGRGRRLLVLRLRPDTRCRDISGNLARAGLTGVPILDATLILDDGGAHDVPQAADAARLVRTARHLRLAGFAVDLVLGPDAPALTPPGLTWLGASALESLTVAGLRAMLEEHWQPPPTIGRPTTEAEATLDELTRAPALDGHRVVVELDNAQGRAILLDAIGAARRHVNLQSYIVQDDPLTQQVEAALSAAAERGVSDRVLVDSLYSLHGSFGTQNTLLARLSEREGVEVRAVRRIEGLPSLVSLKQRNHRKILTVDGDVGIVTGRNLALPYYTAFHEVQLTAQTPADRVPWLDAGALIHGPAVARIEKIFQSAWVDAGGEAWEREVPAADGPSRVRIVRHAGLRDTRTLDTYLTLLRFARERVTVVNTFPMDRSIQRALLAAARRGIVVNALFGHFSPRRGDGGPFPGATRLHELADEVSHGRIDRLVEGGCAAWVFTAGDVEGWDPALGRVRPNVHAKLMTVDGQRLAIGSANLDVTAGYWEDELLAVVDDPALIAQVDHALARLIQASDPVDPDDPLWRARADRRAWLSKNWPSVIG